MNDEPELERATRLLRRLHEDLTGTGASSVYNASPLAAEIRAFLDGHQQRSDGGEPDR